MSLFAGIGGLERGLEAAGLGEVVCQVEIDPFCRAVLATHWPNAQRYTDVRTVTGAQLGHVDVLVGGFPCQDVSSAGSGAGLGTAEQPTERSGLWYQFDRLIGEAQPTWVIVENVASGARRWVPRVRRALGARGYASVPLGLSAAEVGARHLRNRVFIVACRRLDQRTLEADVAALGWSGRARRTRSKRGADPAAVSHTHVSGRDRGLDKPGRRGGQGRAGAPQSGAAAAYPDNLLLFPGHRSEGAERGGRAELAGGAVLAADAHGDGRPGVHQQARRALPAPYTAHLARLGWRPPAERAGRGQHRTRGGGAAGGCAAADPAGERGGLLPARSWGSRDGAADVDGSLAVSDASSERLAERARERRDGGQEQPTLEREDLRCPWPGVGPVEPLLVRGVHGLPPGLDLAKWPAGWTPARAREARIGGLGNAVVPQQAAVVGWIVVSIHSARALSEPSREPGEDDSPEPSRRCEFCNLPMPEGARADARFHSQQCRQKANRRVRRGGYVDKAPVPRRDPPSPKPLPAPKPPPPPPPPPRLCRYCDKPLKAGMRKDADYCSDSHRQAQARVRAVLVRRARCARPMRWAYADPPYPGKADYYRDHPDFAGEVDLDVLAQQLLGFDSWALSMSAEGRAATERALERAGHTGYRMAVWLKGSRKGLSSHPLSSYEVVFYKGWRDEPSLDRPDDSLVYGVAARMTDPRRVTGAKPPGFCAWLFALMGALPGDELHDLFPGSQIVTRAWELYNELSDDGEPPLTRVLDASTT